MDHRNCVYFRLYLANRKHNQEAAWTMLQAQQWVSEDNIGQVLHIKCNLRTIPISKYTPPLPCCCSYRVQICESTHGTAAHSGVVINENERRDYSSPLLRHEGGSFQCLSMWFYWEYTATISEIHGMLRQWNPLMNAPSTNLRNHSSIYTYILHQ